MLSVEATHTNFKVFGLTRPRLELTNYRTQGKHANHEAIDAVHLPGEISRFLDISDLSIETGNIGYTRRRQTQLKHNATFVGHAIKNK